MGFGRHHTITHTHSIEFYNTGWNKRGNSSCRGKLLQKEIVEIYWTEMLYIENCAKTQATLLLYILPGKWEIDTAIYWHVCKHTWSCNMWVGTLLTKVSIWCGHLYSPTQPELSFSGHFFKNSSQRSQNSKIFFGCWLAFLILCTTPSVLHGDCRVCCKVW